MLFLSLFIQYFIYLRKKEYKVDVSATLKNLYCINFSIKGEKDDVQ